MTTQTTADLKKQLRRSYWELAGLMLELLVLGLIWCKAIAAMISGDQTLAIACLALALVLGGRR